ncbi:MAG: hypothetical protein ABIJ08_00775 [Nanoarchaeota archaeon]
MPDREKELEWIIQYHAHLYYCLNTSELSDYEYDCYFDELRKLNPNNTIFSRVGQGICKELHKNAD